MNYAPRCTLIRLTLGTAGRLEARPKSERNRGKGPGGPLSPAACGSTAWARAPALVTHLRIA
jgi:hypothetical protein